MLKSFRQLSQTRERQHPKTPKKDALSCIMKRWLASSLLSDYRPPPRRSAARLERHAHTPVPQAHVDTKWLARTSTASLVGPRPNALLTHVKPDNEEGETGMLDSASHLGALDHGVRGTLPGLGDLPQAPGAVLALTSQMLPPAPVRTHPGDTPVA